MRIFMSYASENKPAAEAIAFSLRSRGHSVFFDRDDLPDGESYDDRIELAINKSDLFIFLITPEAVTPGRFTMTELKFARHKWRSPAGFVLPVMLKPTPIADVPAYLKAVTLLEPMGNAAAEVSFAAERLRGHDRALNIALKCAALSLVAAMLAGVMPVIDTTKSFLHVNGIALEPGFIFAMSYALLQFFLGGRKIAPALSIIPIIIFGWVIAATLQIESDIKIPSPPSGVSEILDKLTDQQKKDMQTTIEEYKVSSAKYYDFLKSMNYLLINGFVAAVGSLFVLTAFSLFNTTLRSISRWVIILISSFLAGALGMLFVTNNSGLSRAIGYIRPIDFLFFAMYAPFIAVSIGLIAYFLMKGQQTGK